MSNEKLTDSPELTLLLLCIRSDDANTAIKSGVKDEWFTGKNKKLWQGVLRRKEAGEGIDLVWARDYMSDSDYWQELNRAYAPMNNPESEIRSAAGILKNRYIERKTKEITMIYLIDNIRTDDPMKAVDHTIQLLTLLKAENKPHNPIDVREEIKRRIITGVKIKTGFPKLDAMTKGIEPSLWIIAGFSQVGKTTIAANIAVNVAMQDSPVVIFSGETSEVIMYEKVATMLSGINPSYGLTEEQRIEFLEYVDQVTKLPIDVFETVSLPNIIMEIQKKESPLYIVDYLQLIAANKRFDSREREISYVIQELARLKQEYQVCIIAISSLNRRNYSETPQLVNLKDSGSLEYASDYVLLLEKPIRKLPLDEQEEAKKDGKDRIIKGYLAKNRLYGTENVLTFDFDKQSLRIREA
jgi:replicative DNA helicase